MYLECGTESGMFQDRDANPLNPRRFLNSGDVASWLRPIEWLMMNDFLKDLSFNHIEGRCFVNMFASSPVFFKRFNHIF